MATSVQMPVAANILDWLLSIGTRNRLDSGQQEQIERWKQGTATPTVNELTAVSKRLRVPFGYFFLSKPIDDTPALFAHRTLHSQAAGGRPSRDLVDTVANMTALQDWARQDQIDTGEDALPFVGSLSLNSGTPALARTVRQELSITEDWYERADYAEAGHALAYLRSKAQHAGVIVMQSGIVGENTHRPLDPEEFRAFALIDDYAPLIFLNRADEPVAARLFSLLHELIHIGLGKEELYNDSALPQAVSRLEQVCNEVSAQILMPDRTFLQVWHEHAGESLEERLEAVGKRFPVSRSSLALRALGYSLISQQEYEQCSAQAAQWAQERSQEPKQPGGDYYNTQRSRFDSRLLARLVDSISAGRTTYVEAYRMTGTRRDTFPELLRRSGL
ncbi:hypothetical protein KIM372_17190 [Bombiscardovia nodaiensis]|uniref:IrrE N-terminal-like domain-containing protein n=1 Tax=Bombiscardovia nodaiensis TaxID=2932181 RepID=A0ABM8BA63_9BIFI|nr:hypothetical protein KIM372_17190 [Bombiscardovia nodaiensis]